MSGYVSFHEWSVEHIAQSNIGLRFTGVSLGERCVRQFQDALMEGDWDVGLEGVIERQPANEEAMFVKIKEADGEVDR